MTRTCIDWKFYAVREHACTQSVIRGSGVSVLEGLPIYRFLCKTIGPQHFVHYIAMSVMEGYPLSGVSCIFHSSCGSHSDGTWSSDRLSTFVWEYHLYNSMEWGDWLLWSCGSVVSALDFQTLMLSLVPRSQSSMLCYWLETPNSMNLWAPNTNIWSTPFVSQMLDTHS